MLPSDVCAVRSRSSLRVWLCPGVEALQKPFSSVGSRKDFDDCVQQLIKRLQLAWKHKLLLVQQGEYSKTRAR